MSQASAPAHKLFWLFFACVISCGTPRPLIDGQSFGVHPPGILNTKSDTEFHGALLRDAGWNFGACTVCHGADFSGGSSGVSCLGCHPQGPTSCDTCHGSQLKGAHAAHLQGPALGKLLHCPECHKTPTDYRDPGHLFDADGKVLSTPVQVIFGALAAVGTPQRTQPPTYLPQSQTCENVYCHGATYPDSSATNVRPSFTPDPSQASCGTCHGRPPASHAQRPSRCVLCHNRTVDTDGQLILGGPLHINGAADVGDGSGTCSACHGSADNAAPPRDLLGNTNVSAIGVGTHRSHTQALHRLRGPIPCSDCHMVPDKLDSPGHIDSDLPAEVSFTSLGQADGAQPQWDRTNVRCTNVYCHGGGQKLGRDTTPTLLRAPIWTQTGQAACGSCHGIPPKDADHTPFMRLSDCVSCHPSTIDATGALIVSGPPGKETSTHINGVVDVR